MGGNWKCEYSQLLQEMLAESLFFPFSAKSTGREYFNTQWLHYHLAKVPNVFPEDVQATLVELTAISIAQQGTTQWWM